MQKNLVKIMAAAGSRAVTKCQIFLAYSVLYLYYYH